MGTLLVTLLGLLGLWAWLTAFGWDREWHHLDMPPLKWKAAVPKPPPPSPKYLPDPPAWLNDPPDPDGGESFNLDHQWCAIGYQPVPGWPDWIKKLADDADIRDLWARSVPS